MNINNYSPYWQFGVDKVYWGKNWRIKCRTIFRTKIAAKSLKMSILDNFYIVMSAIRGVSIAILRLWTRLDGSIILRKNIMTYVLGRTSAISADFGILRLMRQAILAKELSGFASRRKRAAYPRPTDRLKQLSELKTVVINPTTSEDIRRFAGAVFLLSHDVGSYDQHLYLHNGFALVHTYSLLNNLPPA